MVQVITLLVLSPFHLMTITKKNFSLGTWHVILRLILNIWRLQILYKIFFMCTIKKSYVHVPTPSVSPFNCYNSLSCILPYISLQSSIPSVHTNVSGNKRRTPVNRNSENLQLYMKQKRSHLRTWLEKSVNHTNRHISELLLYRV